MAAPAARVRVYLRWLIAAFALMYLLIASAEKPEPELILSDPAQAAAEDQLLIADLRPERVAPGGTLEVTLAGRIQGDPAALRAYIGDRTFAPVHVAAPRYVFRLPDEMPLGTTTLRMEGEGQRSPIRLLSVQTGNPRKVLRNLLGGLALVVFGMRTLSHGLQRIAGSGLRHSIERLTRKSVGALMLGIGLGGVVQMGASASGIVVGLLESRLLAEYAAVMVLLGTQIGIAGTGAMLPFAPFREALVLVALAVAWSLLARTKRERGAAHVILGLGLMFYGVHLLRIACSTLVSLPEAIPYTEYLHANDPVGLLLCGGFGMIACLLLQGPGPVFVLVMGFVQSTELLELTSGVAIMAGTTIGTAMTGCFVAWPFAAASRRVVTFHFLLAIVATAVALATVPLSCAIADHLLPSDPDQIAYGKKLLYPNAGPHLAVSFMASQLVSAIAVSPVYVFVMQRRLRLSELTWRGRVKHERSAEAFGPRYMQVQFVAVLELQRKALECLRELLESGKRALSGEAEALLQDARAQARELLRSAKRPEQVDMEPGLKGEGPDQPADGERTAALFALSHVQTAIESLRYFVDRAVERGVQLSAFDANTLRGLHTFTMECFDEIGDAAATRTPFDLDAVQEREIRINALELAHRRAGQLHVGALPAAEAIGDIVAAYENVGNQMFRLVHSLDAVDLIG